MNSKALVEMLALTIYKGVSLCPAWCYSEECHVVSHIFPFLEYLIDSSLHDMISKE